MYTLLIYTLLIYTLLIYTLLIYILLLYILLIYTLFQVNYWRWQVEAETDSMFRDFEGNVTSGMLVGLDIKTYYQFNIQVRIYSLFERYIG